VNNGRVPETFFDRFGGADAFDVLVRRFYAGIASDEAIRPMYPDEDLGPAADRLRWFLEQYWGGPKTYTQERGHPRLRMRHAPYAIDPHARDRWLTHMRAAVDELRLEPELDEELWDYLLMAAYSMVNTPGPDEGLFA
jgi:hemoglobin